MKNNQVMRCMKIKLHHISIRSLQLTFLLIILASLQLSASHINVDQVQSFTIKGVITNEEGEVLPGVNVIEKDTGNGVVSGIDGAYSISVSSKDAILKYTYIGFQDYELTVGDRNRIDIILKQDFTDLDEVVVVGYTTTRRADITGAVASVKSDIMEDRVILNVADALKGQVSGVNVTSVDGEPGNNSNIIIRGNTSLSSNSSPLYVIDGVIMESLNVGPGEIESIDILKDASSTAIYGARGANGVILIKTKQGNPKKLEVDIYSMVGVQEPSKYLNLMDSEQFIEKNYLIGLSYSPHGDIGNINVDTQEYYIDPEGNVYSIGKIADYTNEFYKLDPSRERYNTDWQKEVLRSAFIKDNRINLRGGTDKSNYSMMLSAKSQDGIVKGSKFDDYRGRFNISTQLTANATMIFNTSLNQVKKNGFISGFRGLLWNTLTEAPMRPKDYGQDFLLPENSEESNVVTNPLRKATEITNMSTSFTSFNSLTFDLKFKNFVLRVNGAYNSQATNGDDYYPSNFANERADALNGVAYMQNLKSTRFSSENTLSYSSNLGKRSSLKLLGGFSIYDSQRRNLTTKNTNFALEDLGVWGIGDGSVPLTPDLAMSKQQSVSYFTQVNYDVKNRYLFKATFRADGSSVFAKNNKWGYFPSGAFAWRISEEPFLKKSNSISNLKFRLSWGVSGKEAIQPYSSLSRVNTSGLTSMDGNTQVSTGFFSRMGNNDLKWETTEEFNAGIDLGLLRNRVSLIFDIYKRATSDLLYNDPVPRYTGFSNLTRNIGSVGNKGVEFALNAHPISNEDFSWSLNFNISKNVSEVLKLGLRDIQNISTGWIGNTPQGRIEVGEPLGNWYGLETDGIWQTQSEIDEAIADGTLMITENVRPGFVKYIDQTGDGIITYDDVTKLGNGLPDFFGGLSNTINYKGIGLYVNLTFSYGNDVFNGMRYYLESSHNRFNALAETTNRWRPTLNYYDPINNETGGLFMEGNASERYPIAAGKKLPELPLDHWIEDASFLRINDVTLSYDLPKQVLENIKISKMRIFITGSNLHVFTKYSGYDPEVNGSNGASSFLMPGLDYGNYPKSRIISAGLNLTF